MNTPFENILKILTYMNKKPPEFRDQFWEVCDMLDCWNKNMADNFVPSWINCIDESMSKWVNEYTCPGFMFVHESNGHLVMNTMMLDVQIRTSFGHWNYVKEKIIQHNSSTKNLTSWAKHLGCCYV